MRISFYSFFKGGGIGRYAHEQLQALQREEGIETELICTPDFEWSTTQYYPVWPGLWTLSHHIPTIRRYRFLQQQFVNPILAIKRARATGADILHFTLPNHLSYPVWKGRLQKSGIKVVTTVHDVRRLKAVINRTWEAEQLRAFYRANDALFVHSSSQADELVSFAGVDPQCVHVVPHGPYDFPAVDVTRQEARARYGIPSDSHVGLLFGALRDEKNLASLIEALVLVPSDVHLLVAGAVASGHQTTTYYRRLAEERGVLNRITFVDRYIPDEEVSLVFAAADHVVLPYLCSFTSQSGVLNIAVCMKKPVLVSPAPALRESVEATGIGIVCSSDASDGIAEGIREMQEYAPNTLTEAYQAHRDLNSWHKNARITIQIYRSILSQG